MTKKNVEAKAHFESKHPTSTFATCFPGQIDPTVPGFDAAPSNDSNNSNVKQSSTTEVKKKKTDDLSFLDVILLLSLLLLLFLL